MCDPKSEENPMSEEEFTEFMETVLQWLGDPEAEENGLEEIIQTFDLDVRSIGNHHRRVAQYSVMINAAFLIFQERNREYGDSIRIGGLLGASIEIMGASARLHKMVLDCVREGKPFSEKAHAQAQDTCLDLINYGAIAGIMLNEGNIEGGY